MKNLLMIFLTLSLLIGLAGADAISTVRGYNYIDESGIVLGDNVPFYFGTGTDSAGVKTADLKFLPDGTNIGITGAGAWDMSSATGAFYLPAANFYMTYGGIVSANKSITYAAGSGGLDASSGTGTFKTSSGTNTLYGDVVVNGAKNLTVGTGATALGGTLDVDGNADFDDVNVSAALDVDGSTTLDAVEIAETLDVTGLTSLVGGINNSASLTMPITLVNDSTYDVLATDCFIGVQYSPYGTMEVNVTTAAVANGRILHIKDVGGWAGNNTITISTEGEELIDGSATATIATNYSCTSLISDGTDWFIF